MYVFQICTHSICVACPSFKLNFFLKESEYHFDLKPIFWGKSLEIMDQIIQCYNNYNLIVAFSLDSLNKVSFIGITF